MKTTLLRNKISIKDSIGDKRIPDNINAVGHCPVHRLLSEIELSVPRVTLFDLKSSISTFMIITLSSHVYYIYCCPLQRGVYIYIYPNFQMLAKMLLASGSSAI